MSKRRNVFISHHHADDEHVGGLTKFSAGPVPVLTGGAALIRGHASRVLFILRSPVAGGLRVRLAHVGALFRVAVVAPSREVVNV